MGNPCVPDDLLISIMTNLPVESLIRFKSVSKQWYALITSPFFVAKHLVHAATAAAANRNNTSIILHKYDPPRDTFLVLSNDPSGRTAMASDDMQCVEIPPILPDCTYVKVIGCCDGLMCVSVCPLGRIIYMLNPTTRKIRRLPPPPTGNATPFWGQRNYPACLAFCFDAKTNDYKVVRMLQGEELEYVAIYSYRTDSWRKINYTTACGSFDMPPEHGCHAAFNGVLHWTGMLSQTRSNECCIVCLDMDSGDLSEIHFPMISEYNCDVEYSSSSYFPIVTMTGDSLSLGFVLCVRSGSYSTGVSIVHVWAMKEYGVEESWSELARVRLPDGLSPAILSCGNGHVICRSREHPDEVVALDAMTGTQRRVLIESMPPVYEPHSNFDYKVQRLVGNAYVYVKTLIPITPTGQAEQIR